MAIFTAPTRSMAAASPGERFRVRRIHFGLVRDRCSELGIREGDVLRCLRSSAHEVVVQFPERHTAALELDYARFVELADPDEDSFARAPRPAGRPARRPARERRAVGPGVGRA